MDLATTGGFLFFQPTTFGEDGSSASAMRSDTLEERMRALKSSPRSVWKVGFDQRFVDREIKFFQTHFRSCLQMEWLPSFCCICDVLGFGGFPWSGSQNLSDWRKGVFVNHGAACRGRSEEERREEDAGLQIPVGVGPVILGTKRSSVSQRSSEAKNRFWAFKCCLLWTKDFPARLPSLEPKKRDPKMLICKFRNFARLSGSLRSVVCNYL